MKKITLLLSSVLLTAMSLHAQTISFEASEGYELGDINGQNNWTVVQDEDGSFIQNQVIIDEMASEGTYSLKITQEPEYNGFTDPIIGGFYNYDTAVSSDDASFSADVYISSEQGMSGLSFLFGLVDSEEERYRTYVNFAYDGYMDALVQSPEAGMIQRVDLGATWEPDTWYNIKIETNGSEVTFYLNDEPIHIGELASTGDIDQVRFVHDNYEGSVYIDNFVTNSENLSISDIETQDFTHFYNTNNQTLNLKTQNALFSGAKVFNVLGQEIWSQDLNGQTETMDMSIHSDGLYLVNVSIGETSKVIKIIKQ